MPTSRPEAAASARWRYRAAVLLIFGAFNLVTFNRYFPLSEGWWEAYGYLFNAGLRPYRDFDLAFTPLFTIINAGLLRLFDSFFALRLLGVGVFLVAVLLLELLLEQFVSPRSAAVGATVATFFVIFEPQFIAKDYHVYQLVLVALSLLLHVRIAADAHLTARQRLGRTVLLGATASLVFMLKQNVGGLLLVALAASIPVVERERPVARLVAFGAGVAAALLLALPLVSPSDWRQLLLANDAKGSLGTVLGRVWENEANRGALILALKMCAAAAAFRLLFAPPARWTGVWSDAVVRLREKPLARNAAFLGLLVLVAASGNRVRQLLMPWVIPVTLALLIAGAWRVARHVAGRDPGLDPRVAAIVPPLLALAYANTTTASFDFNGMHVPVALAIAWVLGRFEAWARPRCWVVAALVFLVVVPEIVAAKLRLPYAWWGHRQAPVFAAVHESEYPRLRGMYVSAEYRDALNAIKHAVDTYSRSHTDVFFYNLPAFYWLHGKLPPFRTVVHWFDVVSSRQMEADLRAMRERPPRLIVAMEPLPVAFVGHQQLKKSARLPQEEFRALVDGWVAGGQYRLVRSIALPYGHLEGYDITQDVLVQNERALGARLDEVVGPPPDAAGPEVKGATRGGVRLADGAPLAAGDVVTLRGDYARVRALSEILGVARGEPRDWHTVNVYVRADAADGAVGP